MIRRLFSGWSQLPVVSPLEGFFMRLLFGMALLYTVRMPTDFHIEPHPVGLLKILHLIDDHRTWLTWLSDPGSWETYHWAFMGLIVLYVAGIGLPVVLPAVAVLQILPYTLFNSQEYTFHGAAMISMVVLVQACTVLYSTFTRRIGLGPPDGRLRSWLLVQSMMVVTGAYLISVFTKLVNSHGLWFWHADYIALDMVKTQRQAFYNHLDPAYAALPPEALWMMIHPWIARILFSSGVLLEAVCIVAIGRRKLACAVGLSFLAMHRSIDRLMGGVAFPFDELCDFIFLVGMPIGLAWSFERIKRVWVRNGVLIGMGVGVLASLEIHRHLGRYPTPLAEYLLALVYRTCGVWSSQEWGDYFWFMTPALITGLIAGVLGGFAGWLIDSGRKMNPAVA